MTGFPAKSERCISVPSKFFRIKSGAGFPASMTDCSVLLVWIVVKPGTGVADNPVDRGFADGGGVAKTTQLNPMLINNPPNRMAKNE
jgi:hypothetical protein